MAEDQAGLRKDYLKELAPWARLFSAFKIALDPKKLLLAAAGILTMAIGWYVLAIVFFALVPSTPPKWGKDYEGYNDKDKKYVAWQSFKRDLQRWNLMYEMAGTPPLNKDGKPEPIKRDIGDEADSPDEFEGITKAKEYIDDALRRLDVKIKAKTVGAGLYLNFADIDLGIWLPNEEDRAAFMAQLGSLIAQYRRTLETDRRYLLEQFEPCDLARKVVGVGSVGTRCWIMLFLGRDTGDPLFLQVKEAEKSVLSRFVGASKYTNQGQRVVAGQRLMQAASDIFLGWQRTQAGLDGVTRDFYVRQLRDWKFSLDIATMVPAGMRAYGEVCGWTLARAHARSGDRIAIAAYLGTSDVFDRAIADFAATYADQNERDYETLADAAKSGRITAEHGL